MSRQCNRSWPQAASIVRPFVFRTLTLTPERRSISANLRAQVRNFRGGLVLDLNEVTLVDVAGVHFLIACEVEGIELVHCSPYIREWMDREQDTTRGGST